MTTRFWWRALWCGWRLLIGGDAAAQCRVEGTVKWADGTVATAIAVSIPELKLETKTDELGRFAFEEV